MREKKFSTLSLWGVKRAAPLEIISHSETKDPFRDGLWWGIANRTCIVMFYSKIIWWVFGGLNDQRNNLPGTILPRPWSQTWTQVNHVPLLQVLLGNCPIGLCSSNGTEEKSAKLKWNSGTAAPSLPYERGKLSRNSRTKRRKERNLEAEEGMKSRYLWFNHTFSLLSLSVLFCLYSRS